jgi:hypothetical protein
VNGNHARQSFATSGGPACIRSRAFKRRQIESAGIVGASLSDTIGDCFDRGENGYALVEGQSIVGGFVIAAILEKLEEPLPALSDRLGGLVREFAH